MTACRRKAAGFHASPSGSPDQQKNVKDGILCRPFMRLVQDPVSFLKKIRKTPRILKRMFAVYLLKDV